MHLPTTPHQSRLPICIICIRIGIPFFQLSIPGQTSNNKLLQLRTHFPHNDQISCLCQYAINLLETVAIVDKRGNLVAVCAGELF